MNKLHQVVPERDFVGRLDAPRMERERIHLLLIDDAVKGLGDIAAGRVKAAGSTLSAMNRRRAAKAPN